MKKKPLNLYQKFAIMIVTVGLLPMSVVAAILLGSVMKNYRETVRENYIQAAIHCSSSIGNLLQVYNNISKIIYDYNDSEGFVAAGNNDNYDNLRQVIDGELYPAENAAQMRNKDVTSFLKALTNMDNYIYGAYFVGETADGEKVSFHYSSRNLYFESEERLEEVMGYSSWDRESRNLILIAPHKNDYQYGMTRTVFTVARNYYDLRGEISSEKYVGTLFLDIDMQRIQALFKSMRLDSSEDICVLDRKGNAVFSTIPDAVGKDGDGLSSLLSGTGKEIMSETGEDDNGLRTAVVLNTDSAYKQITAAGRTIYMILAVSACAVILASIYFSKKLTKPIHRMMDQMSQIENGNFDIELPVESSDEIGILSDRFNQMSRELKNYINQSYVAQIKQNEAELTALKSQIYPHFLYNTLEIIRMEALETSEDRVADMIEALSQQIHYLIGPVGDMVPLEQEIDIVRKYTYLLNCRIEGKVLLSVNAPGASSIKVPKLILQPIVENAYVHGIKPKSGTGSIMIGMEKKESDIEITVMDNGVGMGEEELRRLFELLNGNEPGIKNKYNWQSIGLKNVHDRLRYLYGEKYGIHITSNVGIGTMVRILLPYAEVESEGSDAEHDSGR